MFCVDYVSGTVVFILISKYNIAIFVTYQFELNSILAFSAYHRPTCAENVCPNCYLFAAHMHVCLLFIEGCGALSECGVLQYCRCLSCGFKPRLVKFFLQKYRVSPLNILILFLLYPHFILASLDSGVNDYLVRDR